MTNLQAFIATQTPEQLYAIVYASMKGIQHAELIGAAKIEVWKLIKDKLEEVDMGGSQAPVHLCRATHEGKDYECAWFFGSQSEGPDEIFWLKPMRLPKV